MAPRDGVRSRERLRGRRGALSVGILALLLVGTTGYPLVAEMGGAQVAPSTEVAREVLASSVVEDLVVKDNSPQFTPSTVVVTAGELVTFSVNNDGNDTHTFTIYKVPNGNIPCTPSDPPNVAEQYVNANGSLVNLTLAPHTLAWTNVTFVSATTLEFLSVLPSDCLYGTGSIHVLPAGTVSQQELFVNATSSLTFDPSTMQAQAGVPIVVNAGVVGALSHTFVLDAISNDTALSPGGTLPSNFPGPGTGPSAAFPISLNLLSAGTTYTSAPIILPAGVYWYVCTVPGHFTGGMYGKLYVSIPLTLPQSIPTITNVLQYGYLAVVAVVIGLGAFLVLMGMSEPTSVEAVRGGPSPPPSSGH